MIKKKKQKPKKQAWKVLQMKKRGGCSLEIFAFCVFFSIFIWPLKTPFLIVSFLYVMAGQFDLRNCLPSILMHDSDDSSAEY